MTKVWQVPIFITFAICLGLTAYWLLIPREASFGFFEEDEFLGTFRFLLTFVATLIGVALGTIYRELKNMQASGIRAIPDLKLFFFEISRSIDLWLGLAGSPIVYALILQASNGMSLPGLIVIALQNGFCCLVIINGFVGKTATIQTGSVAPDKLARASDENSIH